MCIRDRLQTVTGDYVEDDIYYDLLDPADIDMVLSLIHISFPAVRRAFLYRRDPCAKLAVEPVPRAERRSMDDLTGIPEDPQEAALALLHSRAEVARLKEREQLFSALLASVNSVLWAYDWQNRRMVDVYKRQPP